MTAVDGVRALSVPQQEQSLPAELIISVGPSGERTATAVVANQKALSGSGIFLVLGLAIAVVVVAVGGLVLLKMKGRKAGVLLVHFQDRKFKAVTTQSGVTIGSESDNQLVLVDSRISRHHAVIRVKADNVILTDLRSRNGTLVNDHPVRNVGLARRQTWRWR